MKKSSPKRTYVDYLLDIADSIEKIEEFIKSSTLEDFRKDQKTQFAIVRAFEIIGEATKGIPASVRRAHADVPWEKMATMRNKLIHEYFGVNIVVVWKAIKEDLPDLKTQILKILEDLKIKKLI